MVARSRRKRRRVAPALDLSGGLGFPFRQEARVTGDILPRAEDAARDVLGKAGFELVRRPGPEHVAGANPPGDLRVWIGERGLRRRGVTASAAVVPIIAVFVAGSILGGLDAYIVGSPLVGILWVLGAAATSGVFWLVYGGTYDSELVMLTLGNLKPTSDVGPVVVSTVFWAARVRSQIRSDIRVPTVVDGPLKLAAEVGSLVRDFERRVSLPPTPHARPPPTS